MSKTHEKEKQNGGEEQQYLELLKEILDHGVTRDDRTKVGTLSVFGRTMSFTLTNHTFPLLTTKHMFMRGIFEELMWILRGQTDSKILEAKGINIWKGNSSRDFLDSCKLTHLRVGDCGAIYGFQLRHYGAKYIGCDADYKEQGVDQLQILLHELKTNVDGRRAVLNFWNPSDLHNVSLPACHTIAIFETEPPLIPNGKRRLSCLMTQRSADIGLGVPFNIASYALLTSLIAHHLGYEPCKFIHVLGNAHIYSNYVSAAKEQITRQPFPFPKLKIVPSKPRKLLTDYQWEDICIESYKHHDKISVAMAV